MSKQVRVKAAPTGHHATKEDRRKKAVALAANHRDPEKCTCGNHAGANGGGR